MRAILAFLVALLLAGCAAPADVQETSEPEPTEAGRPLSSDEQPDEPVFDDEDGIEESYGWFNASMPFTLTQSTMGGSFQFNGECLGIDFGSVKLIRANATLEWSDGTTGETELLIKHGPDRFTDNSSPAGASPLVYDFVHLDLKDILYRFEPGLAGDQVTVDTTGQLSISVYFQGDRIEETSC